MKKNYIKLLITVILLLPIFVNAKKMLVEYSEAINRANNYINSYKDRRRYLIFNKDYVYTKNGFESDSNFLTGGLISIDEFDLSVVTNQSYLVNGKEFWTLSDSNTRSVDRYYIDAFAELKSDNSTSGVRATQYINPTSQVDGSGTYSSPWTFTEGYAVDVNTNNREKGTVEPTGEKYVMAGGTLNYTIVPASGYYYDSSKDDCGMVNISGNNYAIQNINRDISCTIIFSSVNKFILQIPDSIKDYKGVKKTYTTAPSLTTLYFKDRHWYSNSGCTTSISSITPPTITGWTFNGYKYNTTQVINPSGTIATTNLNPTSLDNTLNADFSKNSYRVSVDLNGGCIPSATCNNFTISTNFDSPFDMESPEKYGYTFKGWMHNGESSARSGATQSTIDNVFTPNVTVTKDEYFANLTTVKNGLVNLTAQWDPA